MPSESASACSLNIVQIFMKISSENTLEFFSANYIGIGYGKLIWKTLVFSLVLSLAILIGIDLITSLKFLWKLFYGNSILVLESGSVSEICFL